MKEESEKTGLKLNIQKTSIMASGLITSWQIDGGKVAAVKILFSWAPKTLWMLTAAMPYNQRYGFSNSHVQM